MSKKKRDVAAAAVALLAKRFPRCFNERKRRPLKIGINVDVVVAMAGTMTARDVADALRFYTGSILYQQALTAGAGRIDLDGNLAGTVTPEEEAAALDKKRSWAAREATGRASTAKAKPRAAAGPKRLTLADLKKAAQDRKRRQSPA
jgi:ProP effector